MGYEIHNNSNAEGVFRVSDWQESRSAAVTQARRIAASIQSRGFEGKESIVVFAADEDTGEIVGGLVLDSEPDGNFDDFDKAASI